MTSRQDLSKVHKCVFLKCKGRLLDPREAYGYWAYWIPTRSGWAAVKSTSEGERK